MGTLLKPRAGQPVYDIVAHPDKIDEVLDRQGQWCRIIQARKCPNIVFGRHDLYCELCGGKNYIFDYQRRVRIFEERVRERCFTGGRNKVWTWWTPILEVEKVWLRRHESRGGNRYLNWSSFSGYEIVLNEPIENWPEEWDRLLVTYWYDRWDRKTETVTSTGSCAFTVTLTTILVAGPDAPDTSNPYNVNGDIAQVVSVRNVTKGYTYTVKSFDRQQIIVDAAAPGYVNAVGDQIAIDYWAAPPTKFATEMVDTQEQAEKWGHDIKIGDVSATIPSWVDVGEGDIVSFLAGEIRKEVIIVRGTEAWDELPEFDVTRVAEDFIEDEIGNRYYKNTDWRIDRYNNLLWLDGGKSPATGKRYTFIIYYHPSYRVFQRDPSYNFAENKRFPTKVILRAFEKVRKEEFVAPGVVTP